MEKPEDTESPKGANASSGNRREAIEALAARQGAVITYAAGRLHVGIPLAGHLRLYDENAKFAGADKAPLLNTHEGSLIDQIPASGGEDLQAKLD